MTRMRAVPVAEVIGMTSLLIHCSWLIGGGLVRDVARFGA
jgi:hypothetical protein